MASRDHLDIVEQDLRRELEAAKAKAAKLESELEAVRVTRGLIDRATGVRRAKAEGRRAATGRPFERAKDGPTEVLLAFGKTRPPEEWWAVAAAVDYAVAAGDTRSRYKLSTVFHPTAKRLGRNGTLERRDVGGKPRYRLPRPNNSTLAATEPLQLQGISGMN